MHKLNLSIYWNVERKEVNSLTNACELAEFTRRPSKKKEESPEPLKKEKQQLDSRQLQLQLQLVHVHHFIFHYKSYLYVCISGYNLSNYDSSLHLVVAAVEQ